jgi:hypothetical protein
MKQHRGMRYGIVSLESGTVLHSFDSDNEAFAAAQKILNSEPEAIDNLGIARFDGSGKAVESWSGEILGTALRRGS